MRHLPAAVHYLQSLLSYIINTDSFGFQSSGHKDIITHLAQMVDNITISNAKGSILWLIGEYCDKVPKIAPDVLRKAAKAFINEVSSCILSRP